MGMIEPRFSVVICDAGPLIHLDELGCADLWTDFAKVIVPETVWTEVLQHRPSAVMHAGVNFTKVSALGPKPMRLEALSKALTLHAGEMEALHLAFLDPPDLLLTDDSAARLAAGNLGIPTHGTIGLLIRSIRRN
jgi:predicted nucleic acid-binding protein